MRTENATRSRGAASAPLRNRPYLPSQQWLCHLKIEDAEQDADDDVRFSGRLADHSVPLQADFEVADRRGRYDIRRRQVFPTDDAAQNHRLFLIGDENVASGLNHKIAVGKNLGDAGGKRGRERSGERGLTFAVERLRRIGREEILRACVRR